MAIEVRWCDRSRAIIHWKVEGAWCLEHFLNSWAQVQRMAQESNQHVTILIDLYQSANAPKVSLLPHFKKVLTEPYIEEVVIVRRVSGGTFLFEAMTNVLKLVNNCALPPISYANSLKEACALIHHT